MPNRRMFSLSVIDSDIFMEMPMTAQALYFHLGMRADDDGFVSSPKRILKMTGCAEDDMRVLIGRGYVTPFESGVIVLNHWNIHNHVPKDRYHETIHQDEMKLIRLDDTRVYTPCIQTVSKMDTEVRLGKSRLGKSRGDISVCPSSTDTQPAAGDDPATELEVRSRKKRFVPPTVEEVEAYCHESGYDIDAQRFVDFYASKGWVVGKAPMRDWQASVRTWVQKDRNERKGEQHGQFNKHQRESYGETTRELFG